MMQDAIIDLAHNIWGCDYYIINLFYMIYVPLYV